MNGLDLSALLAEPVDGLVKGLPPRLDAVRLDAIGEQGWRILDQDLPLPVAVLKQSALSTNRRWMRAFLEASGVRLAPHGKTTMAPQLFDLQLQDGAWGLTAATASQIAVYRRFGVSRILMANQLVGRSNIGFILDELASDPDFDFYTLVDSADGLRRLADAAEARGLTRGVQVLVEVGARGARTGLRTIDDAVALAREAAALAPFVRLRGVEAYEGVFPLAAAAERELLVRRLFHRMLEALERIEAEDLFDEGPVLVTAGGTDFFDLAARMMTERPPRRPREYVIRSGCYLTHDDLAYERGFQATLRRSPDLVGIAPRLEPALEVWTCVQSMPEPGIALLTCGKRDISFDFDLPLAKWWSGDGAAAQPLAADHQVYRLNDQHAFLRTPDDTPLRVGDLVGLGVSHVCTTFDKWRLLMLVDDDYRVVGGVRTFF